MSKRRRTRAVRVVAAVALTLVSLTLLVPAHAGGVASRAAGGQPISVGQIDPLTGRFASGPGRYQRAGALLAVRQINAGGGINGRPLKLVLADDRSTDVGAVTALHSLVQTDHVTAIIGTGGEGTLAMTPSLEQARIPMIIGGSQPSTTRQGNPWVFRTRPTDIYAARAMTTFLVSTLHASKIALMYNDTPAGREQGALVRHDLRALGITPVTEQTYPILGHDLTAQVLAIKKSDTRALISFGNQPADYGLLARQMRQAGVHLTAWVGNPVLALTAVLPGYGTLFYGTYAVTDYAAAQSTEATAFDRAFRATFHTPANFASAYTYDGAQILARVIRKVGTDPYAIRQGILAIRGYRGVEGTYNFDRNGDGLHQYTVVQNVRGRLHVVKVLSF